MDTERIKLLSELLDEFTWEIYDNDLEVIDKARLIVRDFLERNEDGI